MVRFKKMISLFTLFLKAINWFHPSPRHLILFCLFSRLWDLSLYLTLYSYLLHLHCPLFLFFCSVSESCPAFCDPMEDPCQGPLSMGFSRQAYWSWFAISSSRGSSQPRGQTLVPCLSCITGRSVTLSH